MESLYDRISKGTISVDEITASMERSTSAGGKYFQSMEKQSETVSGQLSTLKDNTLQLLGSLTSGISETLASDILPGINDFIGSLNEAFESGGVSAVFDELANSFYNGINSMLITARVQGPQIIQNFCDGIISALPRIIEQGSVIVQNFLMAVIVNGPVLQSAGFQIFNELASGIADQLPILIPLAAQTILTLVQSLISNLPQLIQSGYQLLIGVMQGIVNAVPILISAIPQIIEGLVSGFAKNLSTMILAGIQLIVMLVTGIIQAIPQLLASIPQIFQAFADGITSVDWGAVGQQILTAIGDGIKSIGSSLWNTVKGVLGGGGEEAAEEGKKTGTKYAEGVQSTSVNARNGWS